MYRVIHVFVLFTLFFARNLAEFNEQQSTKYLNCLIDYLNKLPDQQYVYEDGVLANAHKIDDNTYAIEANVKANPVENGNGFHLFRCTGVVKDSIENGISVQENSAHCVDDIGHHESVPNNDDVQTQTVIDDVSQTSVTVDPQPVKLDPQPVKLDNEVQSENTVTSGEQFIAIPRISSHTDCFGCASHVDTGAPGVQDLALLAVRHLDKHEPDVKHALSSVVDVERQVQIVNGVRFILTLKIDFDNCTVVNTDTCRESKICKISILEKPWVKLPDGSKFRSILSNNCTEEWLFGDNGDVLPTIPEGSQENKDNNEILVNPTVDFPNNDNKQASSTPDYDQIAKTGSIDDIVRQVHDYELQGPITSSERALTAEELTNLEQQIIPSRDLLPPSTSTYETRAETLKNNNNAITQEESHTQLELNSSPNHETPNEKNHNVRPTFLSDDRRRALDDLINYFNFDSVILPKVHDEQVFQQNLRVKRHYNDDLNTPVINKNKIIKTEDTAIRPKRHLLGGKENQDPNNEEYRNLAEQSLQKYHATSHSEYIHKIVEMVKVTTQLVSGTITEIDFKISPTKCLTNDTRNISNCEIKDRKNTRRCHSRIYDQPWIKGSKEITVTCGILSKRAHKNGVNKLSRSNRSIVGGVQEQDPNEHQYMTLAVESLHKYQLLSNTPYVHTITKIDRVTTQVVSGLSTNLYFKITPTQCLINDLSSQDGSNCEVQDRNVVLECHSEIWDRKWLKDGKQINVTCENDDTSNVNARAKRNVGDAREQDPNDSKYKVMAEKSLYQYKAFLNSGQHHKIIQINKVTTQVVSGTVTKIDFTASPTNCLVDELESKNFDATNCEIQDPKNVYDCHADLWERPWLIKENDKLRIDLECEKQEKLTRVKKNIFGGLTEQGSNKDNYQELAQKSLQKYQLLSKSLYAHKLITLDHVTTQIVSGSMTRINFTISPTSCLAEDVSGALGAECEVKNESLKCFSKIWDRPWLKEEIDKQQIDVDCVHNEEELVRTIRSLPGGLTEQDPNKDEYRELAQKSLQKYQLLSKAEYAHKLITVDRVTTQVVSGYMTRIDFTIAPTSCLVKEVSGALGYECEINNESLKCFAKIWDRPWLQEETDKQQIDVNCAPNEEQLVRSRRSLPGGLKEQDANEDTYRELAQKSLQKYQLLSNAKSAHKLITVDRVTTQVVSGSMTRINFTISPTSCFVNDVDGAVGSECDVKDEILKCFASVWDRPWLQDETDKQQIDVNCEQNKEQLVRSKRSLRGGLKEQDANEDKYKELAQKSLQKYQLLSNTKSAHKLITVDRVTTQVVSGSMTRINFTISPTSCFVNDVDGAVGSECDVKDEILKCFASVWDRPWLREETDKQQIDVNCAPNEEQLVRSRRSLPGGLKEQDANEDTYRELAQKSLQKYQLLSNAKSAHKLITVDRVTTQVVSGSMTRINFTISPTSCFVNDVDGAVGSECDVKDEILKCFASVWDRPWLQDETDKQQIDVNCEQNKEQLVRSKRSLRGGLKEQDANEDKYKELAQKSLQKYQLLSNTKSAHKLITVDRVTTQVVSGSMTRINFTISPTSCFVNDVDGAVGSECDVKDEILKCFASVWDRPWLQEETDKQQIDVNCAPNEEQLVRSRRSLLGGLKEQDANEDTYRELAQKSLQKYQLLSNTKSAHKLITVDRVTTQTVSGSMTRINFTISPTSCSVNDVDGAVGSECDVNGEILKCFARVWDRPWLKEETDKQQIDVNCALSEELSVKTKRSQSEQTQQRNLNNIEFGDLNPKSTYKHASRSNEETPLGIPMPIDNIDSHALAEIALKHIEGKYPHPYKQKVVRISKLEKFESGGIHYRLKLEVAITDCLALSHQHNCNITENMGENKLCRVKVWVLSSLDDWPNIRVSCDHQDSDLRHLFVQIQAELLFGNFLETFKPHYHKNLPEVARRFKVFRENLRKIHELNTYEHGTATYGVTRFADLTYEEFSKKHLGLKPNLRHPNEIPMAQAPVPNVTLPDKYDWRDQGAVTEVKNQGSCGSCWAFSVTGNIEGQWKLKSGQLLSLSEQELVDCDKLDEGCNGGLPDNAYRAIEQLGGLETEAEYPYDGADDTCAFNKSLTKVSITGALNITTNETGMAQWLVKNGPISIGINANAMQFYMGGISHPWKALCNPKNLDHGVLIVGYGKKEYPLFNKHMPYWIVKNSWGTSWGEQGYYRVYRGDGTCGVNQMASSAIV